MFAMSRSYTELQRIPSFDDRFRYLMLGGQVAHATFGGSRHLNQVFYKSAAWRDFRNMILLRDSHGGDYPLDLGVEGHPILGHVVIHHIVPIRKDDILERNPAILDPDNVICCSLDTHNAIHYSDTSYLDLVNYEERTSGDTVPWR